MAFPFNISCRVTKWMITYHDQENKISSKRKMNLIGFCSIQVPSVQEQNAIGRAHVIRFWESHMKGRKPNIAEGWPVGSTQLPKLVSFSDKLIYRQVILGSISLSTSPWKTLKPKKYRLPHVWLLTLFKVKIDFDWFCRGFTTLDTCLDWPWDWQIHNELIWFWLNYTLQFDKTTVSAWFCRTHGQFNV